MSARVILTAAPSAEAVGRARLMLALCAVQGVGHAEIERGRYEPAEVTRRADAMVDGWVYDIRYAQPMRTEAARAIAGILGAAGIECRVEEVAA